MLRIRLLGMALATAAIRRAQAVYADILCNSLDASTPMPDQSLCSSAGSQGVCTLDIKSGNYFCGWKGAACPDLSGTIYESAQDACDFGICLDGKCSGTFGDACRPNDEMQGCLGWILCSPTGICGGEGAVCADSDGCDAGLQCIFPSQEANSGTCRAVSLPPPGPSQRRRRRHDATGYRIDYWQ